MTAAPAAAPARPLRTGRPHPPMLPGRLLRLELRRNAMPWVLPVAAALFWFITYRKIMALPPLWNVRAMTMQSSALGVFVMPTVGAAAWMGSREGRHGLTDLVAGTPRPRWARQLATWAATTCWALVAYVGCVAVLYGVTARHAAWGGPLWWPAVVVAASLPAFSAVGFAAGTVFPSRFTTPLVAIGAFVALAFSTLPIRGSQSYWQISPVVSNGWDFGPNDGVATFYHYLPDLSIAHVMFMTGLTAAVLGGLGLRAGSGGRWLRRSAAAITAAGLLAAGTATALAGTGRLDAHGMIAIPALHDAANDSPIRYTPVCSHTAIPVCLNPAYTSYLPTVTAALESVLSQVAGLPGAPVRISQSATTYRQGSGNDVSTSMAGPSMSGRPPVFHLLLPEQQGGPPMTTSELAAEVRSNTGQDIVADVIGAGPGASPAQQAVMAAMLKAAAVPQSASSGPGMPPPNTVAQLPAPVLSAARRFAALPAAVRHAWLTQHLAALRAGRISLAQLP
jgi:hypothetical protein